MAFEVRREEAGTKAGRRGEQGEASGKRHVSR